MRRGIKPFAQRFPLSFRVIYHWIRRDLRRSGIESFAHRVPFNFRVVTHCCGRRQYHLLRRGVGGSGSVDSRRSTIAPLSARCAWLALLGPLSAVPAAATATATAATFAVFAFLDRARLGLGNGRRLICCCLRFLRWPGFARRTLLLRLARSLTCVTACFVALPFSGLTLSPCGLRSGLRGPWLRTIALRVQLPLTRLVATLVALISPPVTVLASAPTSFARRFGANRCSLRRRL